jgi:transmembrane sensor
MRRPVVIEKLHDAEFDEIHEQAADWFARLHDAEITVEETMEWQGLMASNPRFAHAYARVEETWNAFADISEPGAPQELAEKRDKYDGSVAISSWNSRKSRFSNLQVRPFALAASLLLTAITGIWVISSRSDLEVLKTPAGQNQAFILADGSRLNLGADTRVEVRMNKSLRQIDLRKGEVFFAVAKDRNRPFVVHSGSISVTAVGTEFSVNRKSDQVLVAVIEGRVSVAASGLNDDTTAAERKQLDAGEQILVDSPAPGSQRARLGSVATSIGWQGNRLAFQSEPLSRVLEDVNRHSPKPIQVDDPSLGDLMLTGTLLRDDVGSWLASLEGVFPVQVVETERRVVIRQR